MYKDSKRIEIDSSPIQIGPFASLYLPLDPQVLGDFALLRQRRKRRYAAEQFLGPKCVHFLTTLLGRSL